jgi:hypothetical protein
MERGLLDSRLPITSRIILMNSPRDDDPDAQQPADEPKTPISKPIGDAIPVPVEPGLDQPLPEKKVDESEEKKP